MFGVNGSVSEAGKRCGTATVGFVLGYLLFVSAITFSLFSELPCDSVT